MLLHVVGGLLQTGNHHAAGDLGGQILALHAAVVHLAAAHDGGQHHMIGVRQNLGEIIQQLAGAAVGEGLMHCPHLVVAQRVGGLQGGGDLGGMVGVVVRHGHAVELTQDLEPAARTLEALGGSGGVLAGQANGEAAGGHGQRVVDVVVTGGAQLQVGHRVAPLQHIELIEAGLMLADVHRLVVCLRLNAEGAHGAIQAVDHLHHVGIVRIGHDGVAGHQGELLEGKLQLAHGAVVVQMVVVDVQQHRNVRREVQKGLGELTGLDHNGVAAAVLAVTADQGQLAADHRGGILPGQLQQAGDHGGGSGLAMGACHADAAGVQPAHIAQENAALQHGNAPGIRLPQLGVVLVNGGGIHDHIRAQHVFGVVPHEHLDAHGPLRVDDAALVHITSGDGIAPGMQDLHQRIHTAAADADEMEALYAVQQVGIKAAQEVHYGPPLLSMMVSRKKGPGGPGEPPHMCPARKTRRIWISVAIII